MKTSRSSILLRLGSLVILIVFGLAFSAPVPSANSQGLPTQTADLSGAAKVLGQTTYSGLLARAQGAGKVNVIVGVRANFALEGQLSSAGAQTQQATIQQAQNQLVSSLAGYQATVKVAYDHLPYVAMSVDAAGLQYLAQSPQVTSIEDDRQVHITDNTSTPLIGAPAAWTLGYSGKGQTIAFLDTGIDSSHPFLANKVVSEACYANDCSSTGTTYGATSPGSGAPCSTSTCEHGTHVAGIAAGLGGGATGVAYSGIAEDATIISIRVLDSTGGGNYSDVVNGLNRIIALHSSLNIASVNMSFGSPDTYNSSTCDSDDPAFTAAVNSLSSFNIASVIAAGNYADQNPNPNPPPTTLPYTNGIDFPACISTAISVGATDDSDNIATFSQSASFLSMLAPGVSVESSIPGGSYATFTGTSMATPQIAGAWAVLKQAHPTFTVSQILSLLQSYGVPLPDPRNGKTTSRLQLNNSISLESALLDNDAISTPHVIQPSKLPYSRSQQIGAATVAVSDPPLTCDVGGPNNDNTTVWYSFTPTSSGTYNANTFDSSYDTLLDVFQGPTNNLQSLACNDDTISNSIVQSTVDFQATAGTTYYIMIASYGTGSVPAPAMLTLNLAALQLPGTVVAIAPTGNITTTTPTFTWNAMSGAPGYYLYVTNATSVVISQFVDTSACWGRICSFTPSSPLPGSPYTWTVAANYGSSGWSNYSTPLSFVIPPTLITPTGAITNNTPTFTWNVFSNAWGYYIYVANNSGTVMFAQWVGSSPACTSTTCSFISPITLTGNSYTWWVTAYNGSSGWSPWSNPLSFALPPTLIGPSGSIATATPNFTWNVVTNAWGYYVYAKSGGTVMFAQWVGSPCNSTTCTFASPVSLPAGSYTWSAAAYNSAWGWTAYATPLAFTDSAGVVVPSATLKPTFQPPVKPTVK